MEAVNSGLNFPLSESHIGLFGNLGFYQISNYSLSSNSTAVHHPASVVANIAHKTSILPVIVTSTLLVAWCVKSFNLLILGR